ncbi:MAG: hypothetical protein ACRDJ3_11400, partial [Solirubrobacteraceae bacterium]
VKAALDSQSPLRTSNLQEQLKQRAIEATAAYAAWHKKYPFIVPPPEAINRGPLYFADEFSTGSPISLSLDDAPEGVFIHGATGSGKTVVATQLAVSARKDADLAVALVDAKMSDYEHLAVHDKHYVLWHRNLPVNILERSPTFNDNDLINATAAASQLALWAGINQVGVLRKTARTVLANAREDPITIADIRDAVDRAYPAKGTMAERDQFRTASAKLDLVIQEFPGLTVRRGVPFETFFKRSVILPITPEQAQAGQWILYVFLHRLFHNGVHQQRHGGCSHLFVLDESLAQLSTNANTQDGMSPIAHLENMCREAGIAMVTLATNLQRTEPIAVGNAGTFIGLATHGTTECRLAANCLNLNSEQAAFHATSLTPGVGIVRINGWPHPILARFKPPTYSKHVTTREHDELLHRLDHLIPQPTQEPYRAATAMTPSGPIEQPRLDQATAGDRPTDNRSTTQFSLPLREATASVGSHHERPKQAVPLTEQELTFLRATVNSVQPKTKHFTTLGLPPAVGTRITKKLLALGFIQETKAVLRSGRGGMGLLVAATPGGITRSGIKPPTQSRGGRTSLAHIFYIQELHAMLPASTVELSLNGSSADLTLRYHPHLIPALRASAANHRDVEEFLKGLAHGALVALECEVSRAARTGPPNVRRNQANGYERTIIATLEASLARTRTELPGLLNPELHNDILVVDVLRLLDDLRAAKSAGEPR